MATGGGFKFLSSVEGKDMKDAALRPLGPRLLDAGASALAAGPEQGEGPTLVAASAAPYGDGRILVSGRFASTTGQPVSD